MFKVLVILAVIIAILLILIVVVQNSKGGGLASQFAASNSVMGVQKTTDFLEKATWTLVAIIVVLSVCSSAFIPKAGANSGDSLRNKIEESAPAPSSPIMATEPAAAAE